MANTNKNCARPQKKIFSNLLTFFNTTYLNWNFEAFTDTGIECWKRLLWVSRQFYQSLFSKDRWKNSSHSNSAKIIWRPIFPWSGMRFTSVSNNTRYQFSFFHIFTFISSYFATCCVNYIIVLVYILISTLLFIIIISRNSLGSNDNPDPVEFQRAFKKLLICHPLLTSVDDNVLKEILLKIQRTTNTSVMNMLTLYYLEIIRLMMGCFQWKKSMDKLNSHQQVH